MRRPACVALLGAVGAFGLTTGIAAADLCHTPLPGTRSLTLFANVTSYRFADGRVVVEWERPDPCGGRLVWNYDARAHTTARVTCEAPGAAARGAPATRTGGRGTSDGDVAAADSKHLVRFVPAPDGSDGPDRLEVVRRATGRVVASWPLAARPAAVALHRDIAVLASASRAALYALRITDGRIAQIGIARAADHPEIGPAGVLYQDHLDLERRGTSTTKRTLKLLPLAAVREELARPFTTVRKYMSYSTVPKPASASTPRGHAIPVTSSPKPRYRGADPPRPYSRPPITAIAMDGPRVAVALRDPSGRCDYIVFWNVLWHYVTRLTRAAGQTCLPLHGPGGITNVAIAGSRAAWTVTYSGVTRVLAASITDCQEWVVARPGKREGAALAGDEGVLAYATAFRPASEAIASAVAVVPRFWKGEVIGRIAATVISLSVDSDRVAALDASGLITVTTRVGEPLARFRVPGARTIALRGSNVAVLRGQSVDVYSVVTGERVRSWRAPAAAATIDMHYGIAVITAGRDVYALNTMTGRLARVFHAPTRVSAQVEAPGAAIAFTVAGRGALRFLPMSRLEVSTR